MTLRITKEQAHAKGAEAAAVDLKDGGLVAQYEAAYPQWRREFPLSAHLDYRAEIVNLWRQRMDAAPDLATYPECRGLADIVRAEYRGYLDACGGNAVQAAYHFNYYYFMRLRLNTRYFGFPDELKGQTTCYAAQPAECTAVWFEDSPDGPINGKNLDTCPSQRCTEFIPHHIPQGRPIRGVRLMGTGTTAVLCDEEPEEIFPVNIDYIQPEDIRTVKDAVTFRYRYRQVSGPCNYVLVDEEGNSVAVEQSNCRMAWRFPSTSGGAGGSGGGTRISAVTALSYAIPEMKAFKLERDRVSLEKRGWGKDAPDWIYWRGCDARYARLLKLVDELSRRRVTVEDMARLLLDPGVPFPERISCANEPFHPDVQSNFWTVYTWAEVVFGPRRRTYRWSQPLEPKGPIYKLDPELFLGEGVEAGERDQFKDELKRVTAIGKDC